MQEALQAALDQNAAHLRDAYRDAGVDLTDDTVQYAVRCTLGYFYGVWLGRNDLGWALSILGQTLDQ